MCDVRARRSGIILCPVSGIKACVLHMRALFYVFLPLRRLILLSASALPLDIDSHDILKVSLDEI